MAQIHDNLERLFGPDVTEEDLLEAFRVEHTGFQAHPMANALDKGVRVAGDFHTSTADCRLAGKFERILYRAGSDLAANHVWFAVIEGFRKQGLATRHLAKVIPFYYRVGIKYIHLKAAGDGVLVWPQLGFELYENSDKHLLKEQFRSVVDALGYEAEPPDRAPRLALFPEIDGVKVGLRALKLTFEALGNEPIPMIMNLYDPSTRAFLAQRGIV